MSVAGLLLAAGEGRRMGRPKGLLRDRSGVPYVDRAVGALADGGVDTVTVVLGAASEAVTELLDEAGWTGDPTITTVLATRWADGMGASLAAGLRSLREQPDAEAALVTLVDLPDVGAAPVARLLAGSVGRGSLRRATYQGRPGHPVLLGRDHWSGVLAVASGDRGARDYLDTRQAEAVECGDLASGRDVDAPEDLGG